jgi:hypothetical protein
MAELIPSKYKPVRVIRSNHRFATFEGRINGQKVFIKRVVDPKLQERLLIEATGLVNMKQIDSRKSLYKVPKVIEITLKYIVTEWVNGHPMEDAFVSTNTKAVEMHLSYLVDLYTFIDQRSSGGVGITRFNQPDKVPSVEKVMKALDKLDFREQVDSYLIEKMVEYVTTTIPETETRFTNGDLQPGNLIVDDHLPTVVDCEACSWLWPRHYNVVNFVFNYGAKYPDMSDKLKSMFYEYCSRLDINPEQSVRAFNISAAMRCLQIVEEQLTVHDVEVVDKKELTQEMRSYVEKVMSRIANNQLFVI